MRILYHHRTKSRDGQFIHIDEIQRAMRRRGHEVVEVSPIVGENVALGEESARLVGIAARLPPGSREFVEWGYNAVAYRGLSRAIRAHRPDLLYERYAYANVAGTLAARRYGIPLFVEMNSPVTQERSQFGGLLLPGLGHRMEKYVLGRADCVLAISEVLRSRVIAAGHRADRILVIHNAVDLQRFDRRRSPGEVRRKLGLEGKVVIGFTGFLRQWHRVDRVIDMMAGGGAMAAAHVLIVGDGDVAPLRERAAALGVAERLTVTGTVARDELAAYIAAFDVAVQPGTPDYASPLKLFEYMAMQRAIVMPDLPNIREVVTPEVEALLFAPGDDASFSAAVRRLVEDPALRERLGAAAYRRIADGGFTWDHNVQRIEEEWARRRAQGTTVTLSEP